MSRIQPKTPMLAHSASHATVQPAVRQPSPQTEERPRRASRPEDVFELLRELIETNQVGKARELVREAARRFPDHDQIRLAKRVLNDGKATPNPYSQSTAKAEFEWLDDPPDEARGKWIALVGNELVAMADSVDKLIAVLKTKNLEQVPLVHHLPS